LFRSSRVHFTRADGHDGHIVQGGTEYRPQQPRSQGLRSFRPDDRLSSKTHI